MKDKIEPQNCWEFWNCPNEVKSKCAAFKYNSGKECWMLESSAEPKCSRLKTDFEYCWQCPWFKKMHPEFDNYMK